MHEGLVYEVRKSRNPFARKPWYWRCRSVGNNKTLCHSQMYVQRGEAVDTARLMMARSGDAKLRLFT